MPKIVSEKLGETEKRQYPYINTLKWHVVLRKHFLAFIFVISSLSHVLLRNQEIYIFHLKKNLISFYIDVISKASKYHHFVSYYKPTFITYIFKLSAPGIFAVVVNLSKRGSHVNKKYLWHYFYFTVLRTWYLSHLNHGTSETVFTPKLT